MFSVLVYDIPNTPLGIKRRNKIYNLCKKFGYHVQNSTFELTLDYSSLKKLEFELSKILDKDEDSIRIYNLGKERCDSNVVILGKSELVESNDSSFIF